MNKRLCAYCGIEIGDFAGPGNTHGMCSACQMRFLNNQPLLEWLDFSTGRTVRCYGWPEKRWPDGQYMSQEACIAALAEMGITAY